ncbi:MAG: CARDB domain-containing protein [Solirubrobacteraceae bacterium]
MKRCLLLLSLLSLLLQSGAAAARTPPRSSLAGFGCQRALDPPSRSMSVRAVMRPLKATRKLSLKFELLEKLPGQAAARPVTGAGDLGVWVSPSDPTLGQRAGDVWQLNKAVYDLDAPATYHFRVTFRWRGAHGKVLGTAVASSANCVQRELRPDLLVRNVSVSAIPGHPQHQRYTAVIANRGATAAGPFQVLFTPGDGSTPQSVTIARLAARSTRTESFVGPLCVASSPPTVVADSTSQVDDYNRDNNALTVSCPAPGRGMTPTRAARP